MSIDDLRRIVTVRYESSAWFRLGLVVVASTSNIFILWAASKLLPDQPPWWIGPLSVIWVLVLALVVAWLITGRGDRYDQG